jgi:uncharacterized radical SAM superfamily Fe-S cluster-containing enzyme
VLLEVTRSCNLGCPVCFADSVTDSCSAAGNTCCDPSLDTIATWLDSLYRRAGACQIQLSGGEPTLRDDLCSIIRIGRDRGFSFFQLNTNGLRLAAEPSLAQQLKAAGLTCVFLQFDGMSDEVHKALRGAELQAIKEAAVEACAAAQLPVILVPTLARGVNEQELMGLIRYGIERSPVVRGIHIQPMARFGRVELPGAQLAEPLSIAEVLAALETQSAGMIRAEHFSGGSAEHPACSFNAHYFITDDGNLVPSGTQHPSCCGTAQDAVEHAREIQARRWGTDLADALMPRPPAGTMDEFLWQNKARSFEITGMAFMDEQTLDLERLRRCYLFIIDPQGIPIPFCAYNIAHRQNATQAYDSGVSSDTETQCCTAACLDEAKPGSADKGCCCG